MDEKLKREIEGVDKWEANKFDGIINWTTGVGKSWMITQNEVGFITRIRQKKQIKNCLIITNSNINKSQIMNDCVSNLKDFVSSIEIVTIFEIEAREAQYRSLHYDLLIADEVDAYTSKLKRRFINKEIIHFDYFLGLSATIFLIKKYYPEFLQDHPVVDIISAHEAQKLGFIAKSVEINLGIQLPEEDFAKYNEYTKIISRGTHKFEKFYPYLKYINKGSADKIDNDYYKMQVMVNVCLKGGYFGDKFQTAANFRITIANYFGYSADLNPGNPVDEITIKEWSPNNLYLFCNQLQDALDKRANLLKLHKLKFTKLKEILDLYNYPETIVFSESSHYADKLYRWLNLHKPNSALLYHSKARVPIMINGQLQTVKTGNKKGEPKYYGLAARKDNPLSSLMEHNLLELDKQATTLCTVKSLSRGFNRPSIELVITTSYSESSTTYMQNRGRGTRLNGSDIEQLVGIINLYFTNTIEERKLVRNQQSLKESGVEIIWVDDLNGCFEQTL